MKRGGHFHKEPWFGTKIAYLPKKQKTKPPVYGGCDTNTLNSPIFLANANFIVRYNREQDA